jgi:hypothetical protein
MEILRHVLIGGCTGVVSGLLIGWLVAKFNSAPFYVEMKRLQETIERKVKYIEERLHVRADKLQADVFNLRALIDSQVTQTQDELERLELLIAVQSNRIDNLYTSLLQQKDNAKQET